MELVSGITQGMYDSAPRFIIGVVSDTAVVGAFGKLSAGNLEDAIAEALFKREHVSCDGMRLYEKTDKTKDIGGDYYDRPVILYEARKIIKGEWYDNIDSDTLGYNPTPGCEPFTQRVFCTDCGTVRYNDYDGR